MTHDETAKNTCFSRGLSFHGVKPSLVLDAPTWYCRRLSHGLLEEEVRF